MNRKLLIFMFCASCSSFKIADPLLVERALQNETDEGFISREFFQVKIVVLYTFQEGSAKSKRDECKRIAFLKREDQALPHLLQVHREKYRFGNTLEQYAASKAGQDRAKRNVSSSPTGIPNSAANTNTPQTQTPAINPNSPQNASLPTGLPAENSVRQSQPFQQTFAWFFSSLVLYKEDYTDRSKCAFLFRNIQKDLYEKVEATNLPEGGFRIPEKTKDGSDENEKNINMP